MSRNFLSINEELRKGDFLLSNNREFKAVFQDDGNFVIYGWKPVWASDTCNADNARLIMQSDCNLVIYNKVAHPTWSTSTWQKETTHACRLHLTDKGQLVVEMDGKDVWSSANSKGMKS